MDQEQIIIEQVEKFIKGGDTSDLDLLNEALHDKYLNVQVGFFGEPGVYTIDKPHYLKLIEDKTFGGTPREMEIHSVEVVGDMAMVRAGLRSEQLTFKSFISLVKDGAHWKVIGNFPHVKPNH